MPCIFFLCKAKLCKDFQSDDASTVLCFATITPSAKSRETFSPGNDNKSLQSVSFTLHYKMHAEAKHGDSVLGIKDHLCMHLMMHVFTCIEDATTGCKAAFLTPRRGVTPMGGQHLMIQAHKMHELCKCVLMGLQR